MFIEGVNALNDGRFDDAYLLLERAYSLNPDDKDIAAAWGQVVLAGGIGDSVDMARAYYALRDRFMANPSDYLNGLEFVEVAREHNDYDAVARVWQMLDSAFPARTDPAMNLASTYLIQTILGDSSHYADALAIYERLQQGVGDDIGLSSHKIRAYSVMRDTASMVAELQRLYRTAPLDPQTVLFVGSTYGTIQMPDSAIVYLDRAFELDSVDGGVVMARASFYHNQADTAAFEREMFRALKSPSLDYDLKLQMLRGYISDLYQQPEYRPRIEELFEVMQDMHPGEPTLHELYGAYLSVTDRTSQAEEQFRYAIDLEPSEREYWESLLQLYMMDEKYADAYKLCEQAVARFPETLLFAMAGATAYMLDDKDEQALKLLDGFDVSEFDNPDAVSGYYATRGDILYNMGCRDSSMAAYEQALKFNPRNYMTLNNVAYHLAVDGVDLDRAERYSLAAITAEPSNPTYLDTYAWVKFKQKDYPTAKIYIDQAIDLMTPVAVDSVVEAVDTVCVDSVYVSEDSDYPDVRIEDADMEPISAEVLEHAGDIYFMNGEPARALEYWKEALQTDGDNELLRRKVKYKTYFFE